MITAFDFAIERESGFAFTTDIKKAAAVLREMADAFERGDKCVLQRVKVSTIAQLDDFTMNEIYIEFAQRGATFGLDSVKAREGSIPAVAAANDGLPPDGGGSTGRGGN